MSSRQTSLWRLPCPGVVATSPTDRNLTRIGSVGEDRPMPHNRNLAKLQPLFFGRVGRVVAGLLTVVATAFWGPSEVGWLGFTALMLLGVSFLVGGLTANPGCEITALPNVVLPSDKRLHCL